MLKKSKSEKRLKKYKKYHTMVRQESETLSNIEN
jgi:hypothetical protein